jgi:hypothetical protein
MSFEHCVHYRVNVFQTVVGEAAKQLLFDNTFGARLHISINGLEVQTPLAKIICIRYKTYLPYGRVQIRTG